MDLSTHVLQTSLVVSPALHVSNSVVDKEVTVSGVQLRPILEQLSTSTDSYSVTGHIASGGKLVVAEMPFEGENLGSFYFMGTGSLLLRKNSDNTIGALYKLQIFMSHLGTMMLANMEPYGIGDVVYENWRDWDFELALNPIKPHTLLLSWNNVCPDSSYDVTWCGWFSLINQG